MIFNVFPRKLILPPQPIVRILMFCKFINNDLCLIFKCLIVKVMYLCFGLDNLSKLIMYIYDYFNFLMVVSRDDVIPESILFINSTIILCKFTIIG